MRRSPAVQRSRGKGAGIHTQALSFSFWMEGFCLGKKDSWLVSRGWEEGFLHLPRNKARVGSWLLGRKQLLVVKLQDEGALSTGGGPSAPTLAVETQLLVVGLQVCCKATGSYFITLTHLTLTVIRVL